MFKAQAVPTRAPHAMASTQAVIQKCTCEMITKQRTSILGVHMRRARTRQISLATPGGPQPICLLQPHPGAEEERCHGCYPSGCGAPRSRLHAYM